MELENKLCAKCRSLNPAGISHCKYCHNSLAQLKAFVDRSEKKPKVKRNLLIAGAGFVAAAAGYFWKRKTSPEIDKKGV